MEKRLTAFEKELDIDDICEDVSGGITLAKFCKQRSLHFGETRSWIRANADREGQYKAAVELRKDWATQLICDTVLHMALFDPNDVFLAGGIPREMSDWPEAARAAFVGYDNNGKPKFESRLKAFELVGKTLNIFANTVKVEGTQTLADLVTKAVGKDGDDKPAEASVPEKAGEVLGEKTEL